jgi:hypothetical protein
MRLTGNDKGDEQACSARCLSRASGICSANPQILAFSTSLLGGELRNVKLPNL